MYCLTSFILLSGTSNFQKIDANFVGPTNIYLRVGLGDDPKARGLLDTGGGVTYSWKADSEPKMPSVSLRIGDFQLAAKTVDGSHLDLLRRLNGETSTCVLGCDFFKGSALLVNRTSQSVFIMKAPENFSDSLREVEKLDNTLIGDRTVTLSLAETKDGTFVVPVSTGKRVYKALVDTGTTSLSLPPQAVDHHGFTSHLVVDWAGIHIVPTAFVAAETTKSHQLALWATLWEDGDYEAVFPLGSETIRWYMIDFRSRKLVVAWEPHCDVLSVWLSEIFHTPISKGIDHFTLDLRVGELAKVVRCCIQSVGPFQWADLLKYRARKRVASQVDYLNSVLGQLTGDSEVVLIDEFDQKTYKLPLSAWKNSPRPFVD